MEKADVESEGGVAAPRVRREERILSRIEAFLVGMMVDDGLRGD